MQLFFEKSFEKPSANRGRKDILTRKSNIAGLPLRTLVIFTTRQVYLTNLRYLIHCTTTRRKDNIIHYTRTHLVRLRIRHVARTASEFSRALNRIVHRVVKLRRCASRTSDTRTDLRYGTGLHRNPILIPS